MNNETFTHDGFLSPSAKDKAVVRAVAERLRVAVRKHLKVWFDEWVLKPEVPLAHRMGEGSGVRAAKIEAWLEHSRSALQPLAFSLQPLFRAFGSDWAQLEAGTFRFRDPLNPERRFIPLRLDDASISGGTAQWPSSFARGSGAWHCAEIYATAGTVVQLRP